MSASTADVGPPMEGGAPAKGGGSGRARVCVVNAYLPPDYGGAELAGFDYARRVREDGGSALVIGRKLGSGGGPEHRTTRDWVYPAVVADDEPLGRVKRLLPGSLRAAGRIGRPLWRRMWSLRHRYDVVHVFNSAPVFNLLAAPFGRLLGKRVVLEMSLMGSDDPLSLRDGRRSTGDEGGGGPSYRYRLFRAAHAHVAKSPALADAYRQADLPDEKLWQIPYGVDVQRFRPASEQEQEAARRELGLPEDGPLMLFVGGIHPRKGVHWLLEAFETVRDRREDAHLVLVGPSEKYDQEYVGRVRERIAEGGAAQAVTFVDRVVDNVHEYMRAADVYVLPSTREGLPITVLEAMASGLAVVASDIREIADSQITPGETGLLVPVGDVDALSAALTSVVADADLRSRLGAAARRRAEEAFSTRTVDEQYRRLYEAVGA